MTFINSFGEVQPDRVVFNVRKNLFAGSVREDLPVKHITSVRHETQRRPILGVIVGLVGLALMSNGSGGAIMLGFIAIAIAAVLIVGTPAVTINTAGGDRRTSIGRPFQNGEAESYAAAVRESVFKVAI